MVSHDVDVEAPRLATRARPHKDGVSTIVRCDACGSDYIVVGDAFVCHRTGERFQVATR